MPIDISLIGLQGQQAFADRMNTLAQASVNQANAQAQQLANDENARIASLNDEATKRVSEVLANGQPSSSINPSDIAAHMTSLADPIRAAADVYYRGGAVGRAIELSKAAADIEAKESNINKDQYDIQQTRLENIAKGAQIVAQEIGNAQNESEWKIGLRNLRKAVDNGVFVLEPEFLDQLEQMPYDPNAAAFFRDKAISAGDSARLELQRVDDQRQAEVARVTAAQAAARIAISKATLDESARHHAVMEKSAGDRGTTTVGPPNEAAMKSVMANLRNTVFKGADVKKDDPTLMAAADYIASAATQMIRDNRGLDWNTAVNRAIIQGQTNGALGTIPGTKGTWPWSDDEPAKPKFDAQGLKPDTAINPPVDSSGKIALGKLVKGRYYRNPSGDVAKFDGKNFIPVK